MKNLETYMLAPTHPAISSVTLANYIISLGLGFFISKVEVELRRVYRFLPSSDN